MPNQALKVLWNNSSGWSNGEDALALVTEQLGRDGSQVEVIQVEKGVDLLSQARRLVEAGTSILVAAGGDGTINAAAAGLLAAAQPGNNSENTAFGVIPAGTLNHFARDLNIPIDPAAAANIIATGRAIPVDAATVNGHVFLNNAVLGLFPNYRSTREAWERRGFGNTSVGRFVAVVAGIIRVFWRLPHLSVRLQVSGRTHTLRTPFVLVGNNEHKMQGFALGERSRLNEGALWVYAMRPCSRWGLIRLITGLLLGRTPRESVFEVFRATDLRIDAKPQRIGVGVDGEMVRMRAPLNFRILTAALRVIAPE